MAAIIPGTSVGLSDPRALSEAPAAPPCTLVIFGGAGDLTKRLLMPAIYNLSRAKLLPDGFLIIGLDRAEQSEEEYRAFLTRTFRGSARDKDAEFLAAFVDETAWTRVESCLQYTRGDIDNPTTYAELKKEVGKGSVVFYLGNSGPLLWSRDGASRQQRLDAARQRGDRSARCGRKAVWTRPCECACAKQPNSFKDFRVADLSNRPLSWKGN
jgi:hypothetical protein